MLSITVLTGGAGLTLTLLVDPSHVTVSSAGTSLPVQACPCRAVVAPGTDLTLTLQYTVVASGARVTLGGMRVIHL